MTYNYSEVDKSEQEHFALDLQNLNNMNEVKNYVSLNYPSLYDGIFAANRIDFLFLLKDLRFDNFLDVGCGFGATSMSVSPLANRVYAIEPTRARLSVLKRLLEIKGIRNVLPVEADVFSLSSIDFSKVFDVILFDGVFEWLPTFRLDGTPEQVQKEALKKCCGMLKDSGMLVIAIENRWNPLFLFQKDHGDLYWSSFLPRCLANFYSRLFKRDSYRAYTYGYNEYQKLLKETGFQDVKIFGCLFSYRFPRFIYDMGNKQCLNFLHNQIPNIGKKNKILRVWIKLMQNKLLAKLWTPSFIIFASPAKFPEDTFLGDVVFSGKYNNYARVINNRTRVVHSVYRSMVKVFCEEEKQFIGEPLTNVFTRDQKRANNVYGSVFLDMIDFYQSHKGVNQNVLSHGDLHEGNILYSRKTGNYKIIDWEETRYTRPFFDLLNFICIHVLIHNSIQDLLSFLKQEKPSLFVKTSSEIFERTRSVFDLDTSRREAFNNFIEERLRRHKETLDVFVFQKEAERWIQLKKMIDGREDD